MASVVSLIVGAAAEVAVAAGVDAESVARIVRRVVDGHVQRSVHRKLEAGEVAPKTIDWRMAKLKKALDGTRKSCAKACGGRLDHQYFCAATSAGEKGHEQQFTSIDAAISAGEKGQGWQPSLWSARER